jgi:hypothetical protein
MNINDKNSSHKLVITTTTTILEAVRTNPDIDLKSDLFAAGVK